MQKIISLALVAIITVTVTASNAVAQSDVSRVQEALKRQTAASQKLLKDMGTAADQLSIARDNLQAAKKASEDANIAATDAAALVKVAQELLPLLMEEENVAKAAVAEAEVDVAQKKNVLNDLDAKYSTAKAASDAAKSVAAANPTDENKRIAEEMDLQRRVAAREYNEQLAKLQAARKLLADKVTARNAATREREVTESESRKVTEENRRAIMEARAKKQLLQRAESAFNEAEQVYKTAKDKADRSLTEESKLRLLLKPVAPATTSKPPVGPLPVPSGIVPVAPAPAVVLPLPAPPVVVVAESPEEKLLKEMNKKLDTLKSDVTSGLNGVGSDIRTVNSSIQTVNSSIGTVNTAIGTVNTSITSVNNRLTAIEKKLDDIKTAVLENRYTKDEAKKLADVLKKADELLGNDKTTAQQQATILAVLECIKNAPALKVGIGEKLYKVQWINQCQYQYVAVN